MSYTRDTHYLEVKNSTLTPDKFAAIKAQLSLRLELINRALTQVQNPDLYAATESKSNGLDEHETKVFNSIKTYLSIKTAGINTISILDGSRARQNFLNSEAENFFKELKKFLDKIETIRIDTKIILGAVFNSPQQVEFFHELLKPIINEIQEKNILELNECPNNENLQTANRISHLQSEKNTLILKVDNALKNFKTSHGVELKIKELLFKSENSQNKCMQFLDDVRKCAEAFELFRLSLHRLHIAGFYNVNGLSTCFWSGRQGQLKADEAMDCASDSNIPGVSFYSYLGGLLKSERERKLSDAVFSFISAEFAKQSNGDIKIFSATSSRLERPTFTVRNFHWKVELPILLILQNENIVKELLVYFYSYNERVWSATPKMLFKEDMNFANRRLSNPDLTPEQNSAQRLEYEEIGPERPYLTLGSRELSNPQNSDNGTIDYSMSSFSSLLPEDSPIMPLTPVGGREASTSERSLANSELYTAITVALSPRSRTNPPLPSTYKNQASDYSSSALPANSVFSRSVSVPIEPVQNITASNNLEEKKLEVANFRFWSRKKTSPAKTDSNPVKSSNVKNSKSNMKSECSLM